MKSNLNTKKILREKLKVSRKLHHQKHFTMASKMIFDKFKVFFEEFQKNTIVNYVAGYFPIGSEINIIPVLQYLNIKSVKTALPKINPGKDILEFYSWNIGEQIQKTDDMVYEPIFSEEVYPDLILLPMLGFDKNGNRIGYGKGLYDKTLPLYEKAFYMGCAYSIQEVRQVPYFKHDVKLNGILTEKFCKII